LDRAFKWAHALQLAETPSLSNIFHLVNYITGWSF
jgi:hypothetical protein